MPSPVAEDRPAGRWVWVDLRLVPVAAAVWAVSAGAPLLAPTQLALSAVGATGCAAAVARRRQGWTATVALAVLAGLAVATATAAVRGAAREASPLRSLSEAGRTVELVLELSDDPHVLPGSGGSRVIADATVAVVGDGTVTHRLGAEVLLFASADGWRDLLPGQPVRVRADLSAPRPGDDVAAVVTARGPPTPLGRPGALLRAAGSLRDGLAGSAERVLDPRPAGLLPGLVVGDTRAMDPVLDEDFRRAGLAHLTAVSGANVAIILTAVLWPLRRRAVDRRIQAAVAGLLLIGFVVLAGAGPSVVRAAAMGAVTLLALAAGRPRAALPALAAAVCVLLLVDPGLARDAGFALSVAATAAIVLVAPAWSRRLRSHGCWPVLADALAVSAAAGLATAPLVAGLSGTVSLVSLPANLLAVPAVAPATVLGLAATVLGPLLPAAADLLVRCAGWPARWLVLVAERASALPDAATGWPAGTAGAVLLTLLLLAGSWTLWRFPGIRPLALAALVGLVAIGWPLRQVVRGWPPTDALVVACDVGQGDALVVPTGARAGVLIDAGPDVGAVDRCLDRLGIDSLPLVLMSHLDADHAAGLAGALTGRRVGIVATGTLAPDDERVAAFDSLVRRSGGERAVLVPGDRRTVGEAAVEVLAPEPERATAAAEANDLSMVVRITQRGVRILFTGDLSAQAEARILASGTDLSADVLKVPHHGSGDADPAFLAASGARVALVSVGADNTYGHPTRRLLSWLARAGMRVHRTDRGGDLAVVGSAASWGVAELDGDASAGAAAARRSSGTAQRCQLPVTPCRRAGRPRGTHLPPARGDGGGGAPPIPRGRRGPDRGSGPPRGCGGARAGGRRAAGRPAGRRARALPVRRPPADRGHRCAGGGGGAERLADQLCQGSRPRAHAGAGPQRRKAQRRAGQGLQAGRRRDRRVPQAEVPWRPGELRPQRGPHVRRPDHDGRRQCGRRGHRQRPASAVRGRRPAGLRLRRHHRRRCRGPLLPGPGRGHRLRRRRTGLDGRPGEIRRAAAVGPAARGGPRADRRRPRRQRAHRRPRHQPEHLGPGRAGTHPEAALLEGEEGPGARPRLEHRRPAAGHRRDGRAQRRREGCRRECGLRARACGSPDRHDPGRDRTRQPAARGPLNGVRPSRGRVIRRAEVPCGESTPEAHGNQSCPDMRRAPSRRGRGLVRDRAGTGAEHRLRCRRPAWPDPTCGWRPGSCG
ncbi:ComEC/Rec2 family competence protein [Blastococcus sp. CT_GayMR19]|nr:ComEC/Rec2 family competence protein [Blastococcus sp. CT_GayMR19]